MWFEIGLVNIGSVEGVFDDCVGGGLGGFEIIVGEGVV